MRTTCAKGDPTGQRAASAAVRAPGPEPTCPGDQPAPRSALLDPGPACHRGTRGGRKAGEVRTSEAHQGLTAPQSTPHRQAAPASLPISPPLITAPCAHGSQRTEFCRSWKTGWGWRAGGRGKALLPRPGGQAGSTPAPWLHPGRASLSQSLCPESRGNDTRFGDRCSRGRDAPSRSPSGTLARSCGLCSSSTTCFGTEAGFSRVPTLSTSDVL